jgi:hypothetical protein
MVQDTEQTGILLLVMCIDVCVSVTAVVALRRRCLVLDVYSVSLLIDRIGARGDAPYF